MTYTPNRKITLAARIIALPCLLFLAGCARYRANALPKLLDQKAIPHRTGNILFAAKTFNKGECKKYLGKDTIAAGYQPILLTITNRTERYLKFSANRLNMPAVPANIVAAAVHDSTSSRVAGWGITGLFIPPFLIPAIVDSAWSVEANQKMDTDYELKSVQNKTVIIPDETLNGVVFVSTRDYARASNITIVLIDEESQEKILCTTK